MLRAALFAGSVGACFSVHAVFGMNAPGKVTDQDFPKLAKDTFPSCLSNTTGILHISSIILPVCAGTYAWSYFRATEKKLTKVKTIAAFNTIALGCLIAFDVLSWIYRLRIYGPKVKYGLVDDIPTKVKRNKNNEEMQWYRANQVYVPTILTITGYLSGLFPFLFIPILSWKSFWHIWVIYQKDEVLVDLQCGPMSPFRELEEKYGKEHSFEVYCTQKNLEKSRETRLLYECDLRNK